MPTVNPILSPNKPKTVNVGEGVPSTVEEPVTPATKNLAKGTLSVSGDGAYYTPPETPAPTGGGILGGMESEVAAGGPLSSAEALTEMISKDSPYMKAAETRGLQEANRSGLLNSSMAVGAAEAERIKAAAPFAQQDAKFRQDAALQWEGIKAQGLVDSRLLTQEGSIQMNVAKLKAESNERIANITGANQLAAIEAQGKVNEKLAAIEGNIKADLYKLQGDISMGLNEQEAEIRMNEIMYQAEQDMNQLKYEVDADIGFKEMQLDVENAFKERELGAKMSVEAERLNLEKTKNFNDIMDGIQEDYQNDYMTIMADPGFDSWMDRQVAIDVLNASTRSRMEVAAALAGTTITFEEGEEGEPISGEETEFELETEEEEETLPPAYTPNKSKAPSYTGENPQTPYWHGTNTP